VSEKRKCHQIKARQLNLCSPELHIDRGEKLNLPWTGCAQSTATCRKIQAHSG